MSYKIPVYKAEIEAGIAELVRSNASVAYCAQVEKNLASQKDINEMMSILERYDKKLVASIGDSDLYPAKSILASTVWNKNDDIFHKVDTWAARHTPSHKPDNLEHNEKVIVGHMIDTWVIDSEGKVIADNTAIDDLPDLFHIFNSSVIYRSWSDDDLRKKVEDLIEKIEASKAFVSMECLFRGFDYGLILPDGQQHIVARGAETAFLTKHLRAYGGEGKYENYRVGRVLRNMTFSGKGYVGRPANPDSAAFPWENSINFTKATEINPFSKASGVSILCKGIPTEEEATANTNNKQEISNMTADINKVLEDQVAELKAQVKTLSEENKTLATTTTKASVEKLEASITDLTAKLEAANTAKTAKETELAAAVTAKAEVEKQLADITKAKTDLEADLNKIKADAAKAARISSLVEAGVSKEVATTTVEKFSALSDEQFAAIAELAIKAAKAEFPPADDKKKDDKKKKSDATESALETAETEEEPALSASASEDDADKTVETRKALATWLESSGIGGSTK